MEEPQPFASSEERPLRAAKEVADFSKSDIDDTIEARQVNSIIKFLRDLLGLESTLNEKAPSV